MFTDAYLAVRLRKCWRARWVSVHAQHLHVEIVTPGLILRNALAHLEGAEINVAVCVLNE
jgi:hypothetical protein